MDVRTIVHRKLRNNSAVILRRVQRCAFTASLRHLWAAPDYELIPSAEGEAKGRPALSGYVTRCTSPVPPGTSSR